MTDMTQAPTPGPLSVLAFHCESARLIASLRTEAGRIGKGIPTDEPGFHKDIWTAAEIIEQAEEAFAFKQKMDALAPAAPVEASGSENVRRRQITAVMTALDSFAVLAGRVTATQAEHVLASLDALRPQPSGFLATLTDEQRTSALAHTGGDTHPQPTGETRAADFESGEMRTRVVNIVERYVTGWGGEYADNPYDAAPLLAGEILALLSARTAPVAETAGEAGQRGKSRGQIAYEGWAQGLPGCEWANQTATQKRAWEASAKAVIDAAPVPAQDDDKLRIAVEALEPFADFVTPAPKWMNDVDVVSAGSPLARKQLTFGDCRRAAEALAALKSTAAQEGDNA